MLAKRMHKPNFKEVVKADAKMTLELSGAGLFNTEPSDWQKRLMECTAGSSRRILCTEVCTKKPR